MTFRTFALFAVATMPFFGVATPPPPPHGAKSVLADAQAQAKRENKNVLLIFHASWCGWCHKLDGMLNSPEVGPTMAKAYVITHVDVDEQPAKKDLENPGAADLRTSLGGDEKTGLPFFVIISPTGKTLGTSIAPKTGNIGYPAEPAEVAHFMGLMSKSSPTLSMAERAKVEAYLKEAAKAIKSASHG